MRTKKKTQKKNQNARKTENVKNRRRKKIETHNFKNEDKKKRKQRRTFLENDVNLAVVSIVVL